MELNEYLIRKYNGITLGYGFTTIGMSTISPLDRDLGDFDYNLLVALGVFGYQLEPQTKAYLFNNIEVNQTDRRLIFKDILGSLNAIKGNKKYAPLYTNYPQSVKNMSPREWVTNQFIHYLTSGDFKNFDNVDKRDLEGEHITDDSLLSLKTLKIITMHQLGAIYNDLLSSTIPLSDMDKEGLQLIFKALTDSDIKFNTPETIPMKDTMASMVKLYLNAGINVDFLKTPTDILRYFSYINKEMLDLKVAEISNQDLETLKLNSKHMYIPRLDKYQQRMVLKILNKNVIHYHEISEDSLNRHLSLEIGESVGKYIKHNIAIDNMLQYKNIWKRYFKLYHFSPKRYPNVDLMVKVLFHKQNYNLVETTVANSNKVRTFTNTGYINDRIKLRKADLSQGYLFSGTPVAVRFYTDFNKHYMYNLGWATRNILGTLGDILSITKEDEPKNLDVNNEVFDWASTLISAYVTALGENVGKVNTRLIYTLITRIKVLNDDEAPIRAERIKGRLTALSNNDKLYNIPNDLRKKLLDGLIDYLNKVYALRDPLEVQGIDPRYMDVKISLSDKDASKTMSPMTRGSWIRLPQGTETVRLFMEWENIKEKDDPRDYSILRGISRSVDLDLSTKIFDEDMNPKGTVAYYSNESFNIITTSGDITNAPHGAIEYQDIDLKKYEEDKLEDQFRYVLMTVNSYSGQTFDTIHSGVAGVMPLTDKEANDSLFKSKAVENGFSMSGEVTTNSPLLFDLKEKKYMWLDENLAIGKVAGSNMDTLMENGLGQILKQRMALYKALPSIYDVYKLNINARGTYYSPSQADLGTYLINHMSDIKGIAKEDTDPASDVYSLAASGMYGKVMESFDKDYIKYPEAGNNIDFTKFASEWL